MALLANKVKNQNRNMLTFFDDIFDQVFGNQPSAFGRNPIAPIDVESDEHNIYVQVEVPGMDKKEINVEYADGILSISGEKRIEKKENKNGEYYREISQGAFRRSINIGDVNFENSKAECKNGVLNIILPKANPSERRQKLNIA